MNPNEQVDNKKKKRRKRTLDKDKIARNKQKIKEKKLKIREERRKEKLQKQALKKKQDDVEAEKTAEAAGTTGAAEAAETTEVAGTERLEELSGKRRSLKKKLIVAAVVFAVFLTGGGLTFHILYNRMLEEAARNAAIEAMVHMQAVELAEYSKIQHKKDKIRRDAGEIVSDALMDAAGLIIGGIQKRPPQIELTDENTADFAMIQSCLINTETGKIDVTVEAPGLAVSDDGYYYLFEEKIYDTGLVSEDYIIEEQKDVDLTFSVNLNYDTTKSRLFSKFVVAVKKGGEFVAISKPKFITNPEAVAKYNPSFPDTKSKKGLLVDPEKLAGSELDDLGVKHAAYNIPLSRIVGPTSNAYYPTVHYTYNGKSYSFNGQVIAEYDYIFSTLTNKGITTTAIILNDMSPGTMDMIHPLARSGGSAPYYAFNATDDSGCEHMAAIASFLANRYSGGSGHGKVMNWVIGNEINARKEWNYIQYMDTASYVDEYAKAFRIFYNAILSVNGNARVYISLDQQWAKGLYSNNGYGAKEILDEFNRNMKAGGNIDWAVAQHPYNYPLTSAKAWSTSGRAGSYVVDSETTPVLSIRNIHVLSDYMQKAEFLTEDGEVRHIILSEMGYTSSAGQELQAASFVYAYKIIEANRYIDSMLFSRETDAPSEVAEGLAFGISTQGGGHKSIYNAYKYVDTGESAAYTDFALRVIGISGWNEVIRQY